MTVPAHPPAVLTARHEEAMLLLAQRTVDAQSEDWPEWITPMLDDTATRLDRHSPTMLPPGLRTTGAQVLRCAGHTPAGVPGHLWTVADFPVFPCRDVARTLDMLLGPLADPEPPPPPAPLSTTWSKTG